MALYEAMFTQYGLRTAQVRSARRHHNTPATSIWLLDDPHKIVNKFYPLSTMCMLCNGNFPGFVCCWVMEISHVLSVVLSGWLSSFRGQTIVGGFLSSGDILFC